MNNYDIIKKDLNKFLPFWDKISLSQQEQLCNNTFQKHYHENQNIHGIDGVCTGAVLVKTGQIRVYIISQEGKEITLYRLYPGDICMLSASCVIEELTFDVFVDADSDTDCYLINPQTLSKIINENIYAENYALQITTKRFSAVMWALQQILFMSFDKRLAIFLKNEYEKTENLTINLTKEKIAKLMGSAREVVSRMITYFVKEGILSTGRGFVTIINKEKLYRIAEN